MTELKNTISLELSREEFQMVLTAMYAYVDRLSNRYDEVVNLGESKGWEEWADKELSRVSAEHRSAISMANRFDELCGNPLR